MSLLQHSLADGVADMIGTAVDHAVDMGADGVVRLAEGPAEDVVEAAGVAASPRARRKPWLLLVLLAGGVALVVVARRRAAAPQGGPTPDVVDLRADADASSVGRNGHADAGPLSPFEAGSGEAAPS